MLVITIPGEEFWDEERQEFINTKDTTLQLEHSLVSLSKWESKWCIPFLGKDQKADLEKTDEQVLNYIECMTITQNVNPDVYKYIKPDTLHQVKEYIQAPMTATWFNEKSPQAGGAPPAKKETITAEIIYYWMIAQQIPMECQKWHLNRLLTLIRVCSIKNAPPKQPKTSKKDIYSQRNALNAARRAQANSRG